MSKRKACNTWSMCAHCKNFTEGTDDALCECKRPYRASKPGSLTWIDCDYCHELTERGHDAICECKWPFKAIESSLARVARVDEKETGNFDQTVCPRSNCDLRFAVKGPGKSFTCPCGAMFCIVCFVVIEKEEDHFGEGKTCRNINCVDGESVEIYTQHPIDHYSFKMLESSYW